MSEFVFDPFDPAVVADPGPAYSELRSRCPFQRYEGDTGGGQQTFWITSDYQEIKGEILQESPIWSFRGGTAKKDTISDIGFKPAPPFHLAFRNEVARGF